MKKFVRAILEHIIKPFFHYLWHHVLTPMKHYYKKHIKKPFKQYIKVHIKGPLNLYLQNHITFGTEVKIKAYLRPKYRKKNIEESKKVCRWVNDIEQIKSTDKRMTVVFLCQIRAAWNAYMSTFMEAVNDPDVDVYLLALPEKILMPGPDKRKSYLTHENYGENLAYPFCKSFYPETINAYDEETHRWVNIAALKPDYVFIQRPYQMYLPPQYRCTVLATYTKICYIPYSYCKQLWDSRHVYRHSFINYTYAVFSENDLYCEMLRNIYCDIFKADWKKIEFFGYPRFDMHKQKNTLAEKTRKTVLWLPRWTVMDDLEATTFFKYKDVLINYFKDHPEYKLICRPHPKTWGHFIAIGAMSEAEVADFKKLFAETENFELDESGDYLPAFEEADVFVSDTSSLLVEEFSTGKPIIFCGNMARFDKVAREWMRYTYPVKTEQELIDRVTALFSGEDPTKELRAVYIKENMKHDGKCGERILQFLKDDYANTMPTGDGQYVPEEQGGDDEPADEAESV